ncbi:MAG: PilZ protein [Eubacterium sp.]|jgi:hypothetical protein|nr:PilZ protein [Eubacterium sp.]
MEKPSLVLRHYNKFKPINCTFISGDTDKIFTVKLHETENSITEMLKGDPVLIGLLDDDETLSVNGGSVVGANPKEEQYIICTNKVVSMARESEKRQYERYPTSLLGDIKLLDSSKRETACIKDFSYSGMCIFSTGEFEVDDVIEISVYLSNSVSKYDGTIMRKTKNFGRNEYGISIIHRDKNAMYTTESQLTNMIQTEKELIYRHLINARYKF